MSLMDLLPARSNRRQFYFSLLPALDDIFERKDGIDLAVGVVRIVLCLHFETQYNISDKYY